MPVSSLPWVEAAEYPYLHHRDPTVQSDALAVPERFQIARRRRQLNRDKKLPPSPDRQASLRDRVPKIGESAPWVVRTALCVEPRDGRLHVFFPPMEKIEDYLELVAAVEDTAEALAIPLVIEGELPPHDARIGVLKVTADPGVLEVNVQPAHSWQELNDIHSGLFEDARLTRLGTEKFMLDGRHSGTGGGKPCRNGRRDAHGQPFFAPAGSAGLNARVLAQPPLPELPV